MADDIQPRRDEYVYDFIRAVYPEAPELAMASFDEQTCLIKATRQLTQARRDAAELARLQEQVVRLIGIEARAQQIRLHPAWRTTIDYILNGKVLPS